MHRSFCATWLIQGDPDELHVSTSYVERQNLVSLPPFAWRPRGTAARLGERIGKSRAARRS